MNDRDFRPLPAKAWKETLRDVLDDISMYDEAIKVKVRESIAHRTQDKEERKKLYTALKGNGWKKVPFLARKMRQNKSHGKTHVSNQIVLETGVYSQFKGKDGNTWLKVPTFERGKKLAIPLNSNVPLKGCLRLILDEGKVEVHHTIEQKKFAPCGNLVLGVDKGYTEAFADSEGNFHGLGLGKVLSQGTEERNRRGKARNKLHQLSKTKNSRKAKKIRRYNLGRKKLTHKIDHQKSVIRNIAFQAAHSIVDLASEVRAEDLSKPFASQIQWKKFNRTMSGWAKGSLAEALESVTKARGSCLRVVNAAYTSQMDSKSGRLEGRRDGDKFYHANGVVSSADTNAAINIKHRADDAEISLYTPYRAVKKILLNRLIADGGVRSEEIDRPSRTPVARRKRTSTESELQKNDVHSFA